MPQPQVTVYLILSYGIKILHYLRKKSGGIANPRVDATAQESHQRPNLFLFLLHHPWYVSFSSSGITLWLQDGCHSPKHHILLQPHHSRKMGAGHPGT